MRNNNNSKFISFCGKKYFLNLKKLKEICITPSTENGNNEIEISQAYESDENGELRLASKVEHETKTFGNTNNDMIVYDFVKLLIISLLENDATEEPEDLSSIVTLNTLLYWGILEVAE